MISLDHIGWSNSENNRYAGHNIDILKPQNKLPRIWLSHLKLL